MIPILRLLLLIAAALGPLPAAGQRSEERAPEFIYPLALPGRAPGDGVYIRDAYAVENTWYNPGWLHTGEDWYAIEGSTAGLPVRAAAAGRVVYAGANYPGRVVIIRHAGGLFSMYGHLDPDLAVRQGQDVAQGAVLGTVGPGWSRAPAHLHFEIRTFLTARAVNGAAPRYRYKCGTSCPPGPGYWPAGAPTAPSDMGWRNPTHVIARRSVAGLALVVTQPVSPSLTLWSAPPGGRERPRALGEVALRPGATFDLLERDAGAEDTRGASAEQYRLWYRVRLPDGRAGWVQAAVPDSRETDPQGRPVGVRFNLVPALVRAAIDRAR